MTLALLREWNAGGVMESCFICRKHNGQEAAPPGGYVYEDQYWMICHAPAKIGPLGTLFIESKRHFLDYAEMTDEESAALGNVMRKIYSALKLHTQAERVYQVTLIDGVPHFHSWLVPHRKADTDKGMKFLARDDSCNEADAIELANNLRATLRSATR
jgi:diadenosine tetraphosphate (Ap4A) HIT family hydrolase